MGWSASGGDQNGRTELMTAASPVHSYSRRARQAAWLLEEYRLTGLYVRV